MRHLVARLEELPEGEGRLVEVAGQEVALFRCGARVHALENACPHRGAALASGDVRDGMVHCPVHAWAFALASGACPEFPGVAARTYAVRVEGGDVYLEL